MGEYRHREGRVFQKEEGDVELKSTLPGGGGVNEYWEKVASIIIHRETLHGRRYIKIYVYENL
jgi:hypothetical protein